MLASTHFARVGNQEIIEGTNFLGKESCWTLDLGPPCGPSTKLFWVTHHLVYVPPLHRQFSIIFIKKNLIFEHQGIGNISWVTWDENSVSGNYSSNVCAGLARLIRFNSIRFGNCIDQLLTTLTNTAVLLPTHCGRCLTLEGINAVSRHIAHASNVSSWARLWG